MSINRENLARLSAYLKTLPKDYAAFEMKTFITGAKDPKAARKYATQNGGVNVCGTAGCAIGHGPAAGILFPDEGRFFQFYSQFDFDNGEYVTGEWPAWDLYSNEFFLHMEEDEEAWEWCFGSGWSYIDNTPQGAAARIDYILAGNEPPMIEDVRGVTLSFDSEYATQELVELYTEG